MKKCNPFRQQGFSLLEVLIAFSILSLSIGIMLNIFSGGVKTAVTAEDYTLAVQIGESLVAKAGTEIPLKNHQSTGTENEKYRWSLDIRPYTIVGDNTDAKNASAELFKVIANVEWGDEDDSRQLQIATLRLASITNAASQN